MVELLDDLFEMHQTVAQHWEIITNMTTDRMFTCLNEEAMPVTASATVDSARLQAGLLLGSTVCRAGSVRNPEALQVDGTLAVPALSQDKLQLLIGILWFRQLSQLSLRLDIAICERKRLSDKYFRVSTYVTCGFVLAAVAGQVMCYNTFYCKMFLCVLYNAIALNFYCSVSYLFKIAMLDVAIARFKRVG